MHIRYWDTSLNTVKTRYYSSQFMRKAAAKDVLKRYKEFVNGMDEDKLLQVSMDGPNVNTSFLTWLNEERMDQELNGLHTIHNSFKHGKNANGWNLITFIHV